MKLLPTVALIVAAAVPVASLAQTTATDAAATDSSTMAPVTDPQDFAMKASSANMFEIESSQLALQRSVDPAVADFAKRMVGDHTHAGDGMKAAAASAGVKVPEKMAATEQAMLTDLQSAADFQSVYVADQVKGHDQTVALFQSFVDNGQDGPLKDFAKTTLPTLKEHQTAIHKIAGN